MQRLPHELAVQLRAMAGKKQYVVCGACRDRGVDRGFRSMDGFQTHLRDYHGAKPDDMVRIEEKE